ncbi:conjugal transfer protein TraG N-terminal domain-containing protein [Pelomicrobium methylotrophicum]|uniref:TraG N-terminal Proteobacteria domain-containing protein n=1 Tax=Pelomicrobium methylotrophicum TaxID=2602750 RepID=A0A5C7ETF0_9PROT|nr:conjugal transfer protein TraG N-terminal domain-containing protein [Pelomicrobium methylotrophicum]TXF11209.1 hypothetical protein FR698_11910 [Pelomicrobium methylotrophicum]
MNFEVYSYWNIEELKGVFNAVAALMGGADFLGLMRTLALVMILSLALVVLAGRGRMENFWQWVFMVAILHGVLFVPKTNVILVDRTGSQPTQVVANVPIGLAALAHTVSKIGDWTTRAFETVFSLPDDIKFQSSGMMFGQRVQQEMRFLKIISSPLSADFNAWYRECVVPEIALTNGAILDDVMQAPDAWAALNGRTNPALYVTISDTLMNCQQAYDNLTQRFNAESRTVLDRFATALLPGNPAAVTKVSNVINTTDSLFLGISRSAVDAIRQGIVGMALLDAHCNVFAESNNPAKAAACLAQVSSIRSANAAYTVMAKVAESSMPKLRNAIELVQYAIAPIILLIAVVSGHYAIRVLRTYAMSLVWIQLWPPLYAVVHYIMTVKAQQLAQMTQSNGGAMEWLSMVDSVMMSDQAVAGMLVVAIPPIAAALVKGGEVGLQAVAGLVTPPRSAEKEAAEIARGNYTAGQFSAAPTLTTGAWSAKVMSTDGTVTNVFASGESALDARLRMHNLGAAINFDQRMATAVQRQAERAEQASATEAVEAAQTVTSALSNAVTSGLVRSRGEGGRTTFTAADRTEFSENVAKAMNLAASHLHRKGLDQTLAAEIAGLATASFGMPELLKKISPAQIEATLQAKGLSNTKASDVLQAARELSENKEFREAVQKLRSTGRSDEFGITDESRRQGAKETAARLEDAFSRAESAGAQYQRSLALREQASKISQAGGAFNVNAMREFVDWLERERPDAVADLRRGWIRGGNPATAELVQAASEDWLGREKLQKLADEFIQERAAKLVDEKALSPDVRGFYEVETEKLPDGTDVRSHGEGNQAAVENQAARHGVAPGSAVTLNRHVPGQVEATGNEADARIGKQKGEIEREGGGLKEKTKKAEEPQSLLGLAGTSALNLAGSVAPRGTVWLLDKSASGVGLQPTAAFWRRDADSYEGGWLGAGIDTALSLGGGPLGRFAGKALGSLGGKWLGEKAAQNILKEEANTIVGQNYPGLTKTFAGLEKQEVVDAAANIGARAGIPSGMVATGEAVDRVRPGEYVNSLVSQYLDLGPPTQAPSGLYTANGEFRTWDDLRAGATDALRRTLVHGESVAGDLLKDVGLKREPQAVPGNPDGALTAGGGRAGPGADPAGGVFNRGEEAIRQEIAAIQSQIAQLQQALEGLRSQVRDNPMGGGPDLGRLLGGNDRPPVVQQPQQTPEDNAKGDAPGPAQR